MPKNNTFVQKLLSRMDRVDKETLKNYVVDLAAENARYHEVLDTLQEGVILTDARGQIEWVNAQAAAWLDLKWRKEQPVAIGSLIEDPQLALFLKDALPDLTERRVEDIPVLNPREIHLRVFLIPFEAGAKKHVCILLVNRTEERSFEINLDRLSRIESLVRLAAGVAHEIGNPLNALGIHLQLLKKELKELPAAKRKALEKSLSAMTSETERLDQIVKNFLSAARKPPLRFRMENLNTILEDAIHFVGPEMKRARVKIDFRPDKKLPPFLVDRNRLYQTFINLMKNAKEAMPKGGTLGIAVAQKAKIASIRFQDQGIGIEEEDLPHIFDAYFTTKEGGAGLGLMTVYNTVSEHGGRIDVASKKGRGTTFTMLLPIREPKLQLPKYDMADKK